MKKVIFCLFLLAPLALLAQSSSFTITGKLRNVPVSGAYIYLVYAKDGKNVLDSARITGGTYLLQGELSQAGPATLFAASPRSPAAREANTHAAIFLEPVSFSITHVDSFSNVSTTGSTANAEYSKLKAELAPLIAREQMLAAQYQEGRAADDTATMAKLGGKLDSLDHAGAAGILYAYTKNNPGSPVALFALESAFGADADADKTARLFEMLPVASRNSADGAAFKQRVETAMLTGIGHMAPDFTQADTSGRPVTLSSFRGGYVLIDFWASWCGPCRMENPKVVVAFNKFKAKGFRIIGISLDKAGAKDKWLAAIHQDGLAWTQVSDLQFWNNSAAKLYGVIGIPQNFLLDPKGKIIAKGLRGADLENKLAEIYQ